jgi:hypothetical protein
MRPCQFIFASLQPIAGGRFSHLLVLGTLFVILGACMWVFVELVKRETRQRRAVVLGQWARSRGLRVEGARPGLAELPELALLKPFNPKILSAITGPTLALVRVETVNAGLTNALAQQRTWNLLLRKLSAEAPTTALRPTAHAISAVDLFSLSSYPSLMPTERFVLFGSEARSAAALANSAAPTLLPADIGLVVSAEQLILDFSGRPFDEIEFDRVMDLAEQLVKALAEEYGKVAKCE